jgi:hypothetical protein
VLVSVSQPLTLSVTYHKELPLPLDTPLEPKLVPVLDQMVSTLEHQQLPKLVHEFQLRLLVAS